MKAALIFKAGELYELGCNSSQAVCGALAGHYGLDQETAFRMASSFGDGTSRLRGTCGAADALVIMAGFEKDTSIPAIPEHAKRTIVWSGNSWRNSNGATVRYSVPHCADRPAKTGSAAGSSSKAQSKSTPTTSVGSDRPTASSPGTGHNDRNNSNCHNKNFPLDRPCYSIVESEAKYRYVQPRRRQNHPELPR